MRILDSGATAYYLPHHRTLSDSAHASNGKPLSVYKTYTRFVNKTTKPNKGKDLRVNTVNITFRFVLDNRYAPFGIISASKCLVAARQRDTQIGLGSNVQSPLDSATHK